MEVTNVNQWNNEVDGNEFDGNEFDGNEVEEISLLRKRKNIVQRTSSSSSDNNIEEKGGGLDFIESETKPKFEVLIYEENAEMIIPQEKTDENDTNLPVSSDSPLNEDSTSLINVTNESDEVIVVKENGEERQEFYLENVFEKPPSHGFYCPNCNVCIQKVYIQRIYIQPMPQNDTIRCSSCFTFLIPIGNWLFPGLVSKRDEELDIQTSVTEQTFEVASQHDTSKLVHAEEAHKYVTRGTTVTSMTKAVDESGLQILQIFEDAVIREPQRGVTKKKQFWSNRGVVGRISSQASETVTTENRDGKVISSSERENQTKTVSAENGDWKVISSISQTTLSKQPQIGFLDREQTDFVEVKVDGASTGKYHIHVVLE